MVKITWSYASLVAAFCALTFEACGGEDAGFTPAGIAGPNSGTAGTAEASGGLASQGGAMNASHGGSFTSGDAGEGGESGTAGTGEMSNLGGNAGAAASGGRASGGVSGMVSGGSGGVAGQSNGSPQCGNHLLESGEQCDDGNLTKLDACSESCQLEQAQRSNWLKMKFLPDTFCTNNAFGSAFSVAARSALQEPLDLRIASGDFNLLFLVNVAEPAATGAPSVSLGVLTGAPVPGPGYDGTRDLDWWYTPAAGTINSKRDPVTKLAGSINGQLLSVGPGKIELALLSEVPLVLSQTQLRLPLGPASKPLLSAGGPPGHLATERVDPSFTSFATGGTPTSAGAGELCGNISAASLAAQAIPARYLELGETPCDEGYSEANTLLDLLLDGCTVAGDPTLAATEPDQVDSALMQPGAGGPYRLSTNGAHVVNRCRDADGMPVALAPCLAAAAYSSAFRFTTNRVIVK